jgi:hypothetical protein
MTKENKMAVKINKTICMFYILIDEVECEVRKTCRGTTQTKGKSKTRELGDPKLRAGK